MAQVGERVQIRGVRLRGRRLGDHRRRRRTCSAVGHRFVHRVLGVVDVTVRAAAQARGPRVVLALVDVGRRLVKELLGLAQAIAIREVRVDHRVIGERLAVVDRGLLDLGDGGVDLADRDALVELDVGLRGPLEQRARVA